MAADDRRHRRDTRGRWGSRRADGEDHAELLERLDTVLPSLAGRDDPLVLEVAVAQDPTFDP